MPKKKLTELNINIAQCPYCEYILISRHRHDYVLCPCSIKSIKLDSKYKGRRYLKDYKYTKQYLKFLNTLTGISLDGGSNYQKLGWYGDKKPIKLRVFKDAE